MNCAETGVDWNLGGVVMPGPPFKAEHVGSFLRPDALRDARAQHDAGLMPTDSLRAIEDEHIHERTGAPRSFVLLRFNAIRIDKKIKFPKLKKYKGKDLTLLKEYVKFDNKVIGDITGCCVYHSKGKQLYEVRGGKYVAGTEIAKDPLKCPGEGTAGVSPEQTEGK